MITTIKLVKKEFIAKDTMAFYWEKPAGLEFKAGQHGIFTLIDPPETDEEGNSRVFTFASAPFEQFLVCATRLRDTAFKRTLQNLNPGSKIKFEASFGNFVLHKNSTLPAVFLIGGIGITPVRSIIAQATHEQLPHRLILLFSNKTPEETPFLSDFQNLAKENSNFTFVPIMSRLKRGEWPGETGHLNETMLKRYVPDLQTPIFYLSGPAPMVKTMREILLNSQANEDNLKTEEFPGY